MTLLIVEYISWIAFVGAGLLVGWVGADMLISKRRKPSKAPEPKDSGRGLAGPAEPMSSTRQAQVENEETDEATEEEPKVEAPAQQEIEPAEELVLPVSQAVEMTDEPEEEPEEEATEPEETADLEAQTEAETQPEDEDVVSGDVMLVKRDPSVRVFDAVVAPSERKVLANED